MIKRSRERRAFVARMGAVAASLGAVGAALFPEARARAAVASETLVTASSDTSTVPPSNELPVGVQNALYSAALADSSALALTSSLGIAARLDPPSQSSDMQYTGGVRTKTVVLPVRAYSDGRTLAYLLYGTAVGASADKLVCMVTSTGDVQMGVRGQVFPYPTPDWKEAFFGTFFPEQYVDSITATTVTSLDQTQPRRGLARWLGRAPQMVKAMQAEGGLTPQQQICMNNCRGVLSACITLAGAAMLAGVLAAGWCGMCIILAIGAALVTPPLAAIGFIGCGWGCTSMLVGLVGGGALFSLCRSNYQTCMARCRAMGKAQAGMLGNLQIGA